MPDGGTRGTVRPEVVVNTLSVTPAKGGIKTFLLGLAGSLPAAAPHLDFRFVVSDANRELFEPIAAAHPNVRLDREAGDYRGPLRRIWYEQVVLPRRLRTWGSDLLVTPSNVGTLRAGVPQVIVLQAPFALRSVRREAGAVAQTTPAHRLYFRLALAPSLRRAARVVCVSDYFRRRLVEEQPGLAGAVVVIHEGVNAAEFPVARQTPDGHLLNVGTLFPYKNVDRLIEAFARVVARRPGLDARLSIAGRDPDGRQRPRLEALASARGVASRVHFLGLVPHAEMGRVFQSATAVVLPSSVETFGLPVIEAMVAGLPIVGSNRMSIPELIGDAGLVVDPNDPDAFDAALERVLTDAALRRDLAARAARRAAQFAWTAIAREWRGLLDTVLAEAAPARARRGR